MFVLALILIEIEIATGGNFLGRISPGGEITLGMKLRQGGIDSGGTIPGRK